MTHGGSAALFLGRIAGAVAYDEADMRWLAEGDYRTGAGDAVALGDVDGDGADDVLVGSPGAIVGGLRTGATYVLLAADLLTGAE